MNDLNLLFSQKGVIKEPEEKKEEKISLKPTPKVHISSSLKLFF